MTSRAAIAAVLLLLHSEAGSAQQTVAAERWSALSTVLQPVTVEKKNGDRLAGTVQSIEAERLTLFDRSSQSATVGRNTVQRITRKSRVRGTLYGLAAGFAGGFVFGAAAGPYIADFGNPGTARRVKYGIGFGLFTGGIGAGIGALAGAGVRLYP